MTISREELDNMKDVLGDYYNDIKVFFYNVGVSNFDYKILITRRSYVLYKIFETIFKTFPDELSECEEWKIVGTICNSHSLKQLEYIYTDLEQKTFLIVDDIIINGRTIKNIYNILKTLNISDNHIKIWTMACNCDALCLDENIELLFGHVNYVCPEEWKELSNLLTGFIIESNVGYVSFVDSYQILGKSLEQIVDSYITVSHNAKIYNSENYALSKSAIVSKIIFCDFDDEEIVKKFNIIPCIRFYKKRDKLIAIPYVFLPTLKKEDLYEYCNSILSSLGLDIPIFFEKNKFKCDIAFYHWTVQSLCKKLMAEFVNKINAIKILTYFSCDESFLFDKSVKSNKGYVVLEKFYSNYIFRSKNNQFCAEVWEKIIDKDELLDNSLKQNIENYLIEMRKNDDDRAKQKLERHLGIRLYEMEAILRKKHVKFDQFQLLTDLIGLWDSGKASLVIQEDHDGNVTIIDGYIKHGEQIFVALFELFGSVYNVFYELYRELFETRPVQLLKCATYFDEKYSINLFSDFVKRIDYENYSTDLIATSPAMVSNYFYVKDPNKEIIEYIKNTLKTEKT